MEWFGEIRALCEAATTRPETIGDLIWALLHRPEGPRGDELLYYVIDRLSHLPRATVDLGELVSWSIQCADALEVALAERQAEWITQGKLDRVLMRPVRAREWACGTAWLIVRGEGVLPTDPHTVNWSSLVDEATGRWVGCGLLSGREMAIYHGQDSPHDEEDDDDSEGWEDEGDATAPTPEQVEGRREQSYRICLDRDGSPWPGISAHARQLAAPPSST